MREPRVDDFYLDPVEDHVANKRLAEFLRERNRRDRFAAAALTGLLANLAALRKEGFRDGDIDEFARMRADGLIAELDKPQVPPRDRTQDPDL